MKNVNTITLKHDISVNSNPFYVRTKIEIPKDISLEELFHAFKQIAIALTFSEEQFNEYIDNG